MTHREDLDPSKKNGKRWVIYTRRCGFVDYPESQNSLTIGASSAASNRQ
jgi:hypothetical protein